MDFIQYISKFSALYNTSAWGDGGFVCIDISSCYQNLAAQMLIFTFLTTLLKYMVVAALCNHRPNSGSNVDVECFMYFKFHPPLHAPLFHYHVTLWGALGRSEKSGGEVHLVDMASKILRQCVDPSRLETNITLSFRDTWNRRDLTVIWSTRLWTKVGPIDG